MRRIRNSGFGIRNWVRGAAARVSRAALLGAAAICTTLAPLAQDSKALRETQVVKVVRQVSPAVVYVSCQQRVQNPFAGPFWDLFGDDSGPSGPMEQANSLGSGVIVDPAGYILTNEHVIFGGTQIKITLTSGKTFAAKVVGTAPEADLALLKIEGEGSFPTAQLGRSDDLMIGESVIAVGNPFGLSNTVSVGVLSAVGRTVNAGKRRYSDFIQTDAPINPGNSGGPLLNILGQVIGINTAIIREAQGIGFAIPVDRAKRVMEQLRAYGRVRPTWLGFLPLDPSESYRRRVGVKGGIIVAKTYPYAYREDQLKEGDIVTSLNGKPLEGTGDFNSLLSLLTSGQKAEIAGTRDGNRFTASLPVELMPEKLTPGMAWELLGIKITANRGHVVVSDVRDGSPADSTGLREGDAILAVEDEPIKTPDEFLARARSALGSTGLVMSVGRGPWNYYVTLNLIQ